MRSTSEHKINGCLILLVCLAMVVSAYAEGDSNDNTFVPVIVNVVGTTDTSGAGAALQKANEILEQADITLNVVKVNTNCSIGDGNSSLTGAEGDTAVEAGEDELQNELPLEGGIKLYFANNCWVERPEAMGWSIHGEPVAFVEPYDDTNDMGEVIAHEACHILTLDYDLYDGNDPNRLMWFSADRTNTVLDANEVNEIREGVDKLGVRSFKVFVRDGKVVPPAKGSIVIGATGAPIIRGYGQILDGLRDVFCPAPGFDPCNPNWRYADIRWVRMFWGKPMDLSDEIVFAIVPKGPYDVDSFFDISYLIRINMDSDPNIDAELSMHVYARPPDPTLHGEALLTNHKTGLITPFELVIRANHKFDGGPPILANHSVECDVPAGYFGPGSDPFEGWACQVTSTATDERILGYPMIDETLPFEFGLTEPFEEQQMSVFVPYGVSGKLGVVASGFPAMSEATIMMDGEEAGITQVRANGTVMAWILAPPEGQNHTCKLVAGVTDPIDPNVTRYTNATAYFRTCAEGAVNGDLNADCEVNFEDLAVIADNWLAGV